MDRVQRLNDKQRAITLYITGMPFKMPKTNFEIKECIKGHKSEATQRPLR